MDPDLGVESALCALPLNEGADNDIFHPLKEGAAISHLYRDLILRGRAALWKRRKVEKSEPDFPTLLGKRFAFPTFPQGRRLLNPYSALLDTKNKVHR